MSFLTKIFDFAFGWLSPSIPKQPYSGGVEVTLQAPAEDPLIYGDCRDVAGIIVNSKVINPVDDDDIPNDIIYLQVIWSRGSIESVDKLYLDGIDIEDAQFNAGGTTRVAHAWHFEDGDDQQWTHPTTGAVEFQAFGRGYSYSVVRLEFSPEKMPSFPTITGDITGRKLYPAGTVSLPVAIAYSNNHADCLYDFMSSAAYGCNLPFARLNATSFLSEQAFGNTTVVPFTGASNVRVMTCNVRLNLNDSLLSNIKILLQGCRGYLPYDKGQFNFLIERERTPIAFEITDENKLSDLIIEDNEIKDFYNKVTVRYKDRAQRGKVNTAVYPADNSAFVAIDGRELPFTITIDAINNEYEALQAAEIIFKRSRDSLKVKVVVKSEGKAANIGSVVNVTNAAFVMVQKPFIVVNRKIRASGVVELELLEYQSNIYPWNLKPEQIIPDTNAVDPTIVSIPTNLAVSFPNDGTAQAVLTWNSPHKTFLVDVGGEKIITTIKSLPLVNMVTGDRTFTIQAINGLGRRSAKATLSFTIALPSVPALNIVVGVNDVQITPSVTGSQIGVTFELRLNTVNTFGSATSKGYSGSFTLAGLIAETTYWIWVRTINVAGSSSFASTTFTTLEAIEGTQGSRGAGTFYGTASSWSDVKAHTATEGDSVLGDRVTLTNGTDYIETKYWNGTNAWLDAEVVVDGNTVINGDAIIDQVFANKVFSKDVTATNTITGATIRTAASGARTVLSSAKPLSIYDAAGSSLFNVTSSGEANFSGGINGIHSITSSDIFSPALWSAMTAVVGGTEVGATGGTQSITNQSMPSTQSLTIASINAQDIAISVNVTASGFRFSSPYSQPTWNVKIYRGNVATGTIIHNVNYSGSVTDSGGEYELNFSASVSISDTTPELGTGLYTLVVDKTAGDLGIAGAAKITSFSIVQPIEGTGGGGGTYTNGMGLLLSGTQFSVDFNTVAAKVHTHSGYYQFGDAITGSSFTIGSSKYIKNIKHRENLNQSLMEVVEIGRKGVAVGSLKADKTKEIHNFFIAEEVYDIDKKCVTLDAKDKPMGVKVVDLLVKAYAAIAVLSDNADKQEILIAKLMKRLK